MAYSKEYNVSGSVRETSADGRRTVFIRLSTQQLPIAEIRTGGQVEVDLGHDDEVLGVTFSFAE